MMDDLSVMVDAALIEAIAKRQTPREIWLQRVSFAYGNCSLSNPAITRDMVTDAAVKLYGPCPPRE